MQTLAKQQIKQDHLPAAIGEGWELFLPAAIDNEDVQELKETRSALRRAETVIRAQEERIRQLQQMASTDELTGLANRRGFVAAFERELALANRDESYSGILVMIDLDGFKEINDKWGHPTGDAYLCAVADVLKETIRASDSVARLGGDEFAILLTHLNEKTGAKRVAKLEQAFNKRSVILNERFPLRASFGFAPYVAGNNTETVMQSADLRMYGHKARNKKLISVAS